VRRLEHLGQGVELVPQGMGISVEPLPPHDSHLPLEWQMSSAGELHPRALPEPYVSLSAHTAPINQPWASPRGAASEQKVSADDVRSAPASVTLAGDAP
jgi:hypothetical protein